MKRRIAFGVLTILWVGMIFWHSAQDAAVSSDMSGGLLEWLGLPISERFLRKTAHFMLFAVLGVLLSGTLCAGKLPIGWILLLALAAACADETIQSFPQGRSSEVRDVWLDFSGSVTGLGAFAAVRWLFIRKNFHCKSK
ncbi:MAG: VanZ family protein [Clostridia bacterium]|nr:VanZ family protein [Clostridia bacterium]